VLNKSFTAAERWLFQLLRQVPVDAYHRCLSLLYAVQHMAETFNSLDHVVLTVSDLATLLAKPLHGLLSVSCN
jgi:hypothetical protein